MGHPDHVSGASFFAGSHPEVIAFAPVRPALARTELVGTILNRRGTRQFGYELNNEEAISQGIGIREGFTIGEGTRNPLPPTTVYAEDEARLDIDGVQLTLVAAPGETEDQIFIWNDEHKVLFCGDNYYGCWPNLYAIRGGQYRDIAGWIASLRSHPRVSRRSAPARAHPPDHRPGGSGRGACELPERARLCIDGNPGTAWTGAWGSKRRSTRVKLPEQYARLPYLQEFYGTVAWSVRSIYTGYLGWFDGNPTNLNPLPPQARAVKSIAQMGGKATVAEAVSSALASGDTQWALELADLLLTLDPENAEIRRAKASGLMELARQETSANGRHYYLAYAKELLAETE